MLDANSGLWTKHDFATRKTEPTLLMEMKASVKVFGVLLLHGVSLATGAFKEAELHVHKEGK